MTESGANYLLLYSWNIPWILHQFLSFQSLHCYHILNFPVAAYHLIWVILTKIQVLGTIHKGCPHQGGRGSAKWRQLRTGGGGGLVKWECPHFETFCKYILEIAQAGNYLCNWIQVTCYLTTPKSYLGYRKPK